MRGSKYIQSKLGDTFKNVKVDLDAQRSVLFSGTSCQVAGLKKYLGKEYENLFCVDIVCHGVPSKKVWDAYLRWQEQKKHSKVANVEFRNKRDFGWRDHVETIRFSNNKSTNCKVFTNLFYGHTQEINKVKLQNYRQKVIKSISTSKQPQSFQKYSSKIRKSVPFNSVHQCTNQIVIQPYHPPP